MFIYYILYSYIKMKKENLFAIIGVLFAVNLYLVLSSGSITGYSIAQRTQSLFFGEAFSAIAPILILSATLTIGLYLLHDIKTRK